MISIIGILYGSKFSELIIKQLSSFKHETEKLEISLFVIPDTKEPNTIKDEIEKLIKEKYKVSLKLYIVVKPTHLCTLLNIAVKQTKGDYILFIDGRDLYREDYLDTMYNLITDREELEVVILTPVFTYSEQMKYLFIDKSLEHFNLYHSIFKKHVLEKYPFPIEDINIPSDIGEKYFKTLPNKKVYTGYSNFKIYMHIIKNEDKFSIATQNPAEVFLLKEEVSKEEAIEFAFTKNPEIRRGYDLQDQPSMTTLELEELPHISLVTPTKNRKDYFWIAIENFKNQSYPLDKIEWIIGEDGDDCIKDMLPTEYNIKYYYSEKDIDNIGDKRNFCIEKATNDIIVFMDDDDFHNKKSIENRVRALLGLKEEGKDIQLVGSKDMLIYYPEYDECRYLECRAKRQIHEGTMAFYKNFWEENKFTSKKSAEGAEFIDNRIHKVHHLTVSYIMIAITHTNNTTDKNQFYNALPKLERNKLNFTEEDNKFLLSIKNKYY